MNKTIIGILIAAAIIIAGGAAAYLLTREQNEDSALNNQNESAQQTDETEGRIANTSIGKLFSAGVARKCTYTDESSTGTLYLTTNDRMRVDFTTTGEDAGSGGMIVTDEKQHIWDDATKEGVTMAFDRSSFDSDEGDHADDDTVNVDHEYDFDCNLWMVDESVFTPPADVTFTDMASLMEGFVPQN